MKMKPMTLGQRKFCLSLLNELTNTALDGIDNVGGANYDNIIAEAKLSLRQNLEEIRIKRLRLKNA